MANKVSFIIQLKDKFGPVSDKVSGKFRKMEMNARRTNRELEKQEKKWTGLRQKSKRMAAQGAIATAAITAPLLMISKSMIASASDATETANKFNAVFDDVEGKANTVADSFAKNFGTAGSTSRKLIGDTGDLLVGFGFTGDAALELSRKVNELAADLTSFQNVEGGVQSASSALTKALLGETESAKSLGIVIRQNTPEFRRQVKTIARAKKITEQQAKAIVILGMATKQSTKAIGDTKRTWEDYASVVRRNEEQTKKMSESFGRLLIPIATKVTRVLTSVFTWLEKLSPAWKGVILGVAGFMAVGGPLLLLLGGIAFAVTAISLPVLIVGAALLALGAIIAAVALNWDRITQFMSEKWTAFATFVGTIAESIGKTFANLWTVTLSGLVKFVNFAIGYFNTLLKPFDLIAETLGFGGVEIPDVQIARTMQMMDARSAPTAPDVGGAQGTLNGMIMVSAEKGTSIKQTSMETGGGGLNIGMNVIPGGA